GHEREITTPKKKKKVRKRKQPWLEGIPVNGSLACEMKSVDSGWPWTNSPLFMASFTQMPRERADGDMCFEVGQPHACLTGVQRLLCWWKVVRSIRNCTVKFHLFVVIPRGGRWTTAVSTSEIYLSRPWTMSP
ncbi:unnamed protein product, partial [Ectocarpus sp. 6 AP-2014]